MTKKKRKTTTTTTTRRKKFVKKEEKRKRKYQSPITDKVSIPFDLISLFNPKRFFLCLPFKLFATIYLVSVISYFTSSFFLPPTLFGILAYDFCVVAVYIENVVHQFDFSFFDLSNRMRLTSSESIVCPKVFHVRSKF